jgi:glycosyltransferase involved in cell wall biosynthesis
VPESAVRPWPRRGRPRSVVVGCVGGLDPIKGWELVMHALALVPSTVPLRVVHIGATGSSAVQMAYAAGLRRLGEKLGLGDRWEWRGEMREVAGFYTGIDCLVVASRLEAFSVAALEAIAAGVPVLAPTGSGTTDLIAACGGGWTYEADSAAALSVRLAGLVTGPDLENSRRDDEGLRAFTVPQVANAHAAAYGALIQP